MPSHQPSAAHAAIARYFEVALFGMVVAGFVTLVSTRAVAIPYLLLTAAALAARGYLLGRNASATLVSVRWSGLATLAFVAYSAADFFLLGGDFVSTTTHLLLVILVVKLFSVHRERDNLYLAVLAFLQVLIASVLTVGALFLAGFLLFLAMAVVTFVSLEMKRSSAAAAVQSRVPDGAFAGKLTGTSAAVMFAIALGATVLFFLIPRVSGGYMSRFAPKNNVVTGFSDTVSFGTIGRIQQSTAVVMRVQVSRGEALPPDVKWRGIALDTFDGTQWTARRARTLLAPSARGSYALRQLDDRPARDREDRFLGYRVVLEPIGTDVFFLIPTPERLDGGYRELATDTAGSYFNRDPERPVGSYTAVSSLRTPEHERLRRAGNMYPASLALQYLQLPRMDARVGRLAAQIMAEHDNAYDRAAAVEGYLKTQFGYTLELPDAVPKDPIADFLFERKQGHCEYFASAMALMLRSQGIPARVVNGFRGAEKNDVSGSYVVRALNAHSWVEAYFPGTGWVEFDPTPPGPEIGGGQWRRMALYLDAMQEFWREWVINYDFRHQHTIAAGTVARSRFTISRLRWIIGDWYESGMQKLRRAQRGMRQAPGRWALWAAAAVGLALLLAAAPQILRAIRAAIRLRRGRAAPRVAAAEWFLRLERLLARKGWARAPSQTPAELAAGIDPAEVKQAVEAFVARYERARYGESGDDAAELPEAYEEVASRLR